ncbi:hypothetical protein NHQ30_002831 [Ciborinia camelliae]|nr:hypothetical protein NHQ30_002831 [Ciborinia camelliae]
MDHAVQADQTEDAVQADQTEDSRMCPKLKIFSLPDNQTPDTRFVLFGETEIQLHSVILKLHSEFFRKFLDSPDKKPAEASAKFRYEWVSEIEEDGTWHMVDKSHAKPNDYQLLGDAVHQDIEILTFMELLDSLYRIPYKVFVARLIKITKMADYYRCLPAVSHNLYACFAMSDNWYVREHAVTLLDVAYKLRQPLLFKDCLIHVAGFTPPGASNPIHLCNKKLWNVMVKARNEINRRIVECQREILMVPPSEERTKLLGHCWQSGSQDTNGFFTLPRYFRLLANHDNTFAEILKNVLSCELHMPSESNYEAGGDDSDDNENLIHANSNQFFCARLMDEDLPWDLNETDW